MNIKNVSTFRRVEFSSSTADWRTVLTIVKYNLNVQFSM